MKCLSKSKVCQTGAITLSIVMYLTLPASVQAEAPPEESYSPPQATEEAYNPPLQAVENRSYDLGWLGLIGLAGLTGLIRRRTTSKHPT